MQANQLQGFRASGFTPACSRPTAQRGAASVLATACITRNILGLARIHKLMPRMLIFTHTQICMYIYTYIYIYLCVDTRIRHSGALAAALATNSQQYVCISLSLSLCLSLSLSLCLFIAISYLYVCISIQSGLVFRNPCQTGNKTLGSVSEEHIQIPWSKLFTVCFWKRHVILRYIYIYIHI